MEKIVTFRIDPQLWKKARKKANNLGRTLSGQIRYLLIKFVEDEK
ncbi:MAG: plasmid transcriptional repressor protein [Candidatus Marinimicrobia bacterium]|nr:plasmid transcriptional repressor protein [Candidatus Neomarinimicrobiota bacterium]